jgi:hypothetical protein
MVLWRETNYSHQKEVLCDFAILFNSQGLRRSDRIIMPLGGTYRGLSCLRSLSIILTILDEENIS